MIELFVGLGAFAVGSSFLASVTGKSPTKSRLQIGLIGFCFLVAGVIIFAWGLGIAR